MKLRRTVPSFASILACAAASDVASAATISPFKDAFLSAVNPGSNYGGAGALEISGADAASGKGELQSVLAFDFAAIKTSFDTTFGANGWQIDTLSLQLNATLPNNALFNANASGTIAARWFADDGWVEGTGTPMSVQPVAGVNYSALAGLLASDPGAENAGSASYNGANSGTTSITLSSAGLFDDIYHGRVASLDLFAGTSTTSGLFNSKSGTNPPVLTITAVSIPEPAMTTWAACALAGCVLRRRR